MLFTDLERNENFATVREPYSLFINKYIGSFPIYLKLSSRGYASVMFIYVNAEGMQVETEVPKEIGGPIAQFQRNELMFFYNNLTTGVH